MNNITLLDGAMGTELIKSGIELGKFTDGVNLTHPQAVTDIHRNYVDAGSKIIYACTFGCNPGKAENSGYDLHRLIGAALENARAACNADTRVALDIGTLGRMLEPYGEMSAAAAREMFRETARAGRGADLAVIETMWDINEAIIALEAVKEAAGIPVFVTMTFQQGGRTMSGCTPAEMARELTAAGADAVGINCSLGPEDTLPLMRQLAECCTLPLIAKPNAGMPDPKTGSYRTGPEEFARLMLPIAELGVSYMGGCCGTTPAHIRALKSILEGRQIF